MWKNGVYGSALIKNRRYWPKGFHRDGINNGIRSKNIGDMGCIIGEWDETEFDVFILKEPDHNIMTMSNFLGLTVPECQKEERRMVNREAVKFKYPEVVVYHYRYREVVDNQNSLRHDGRTKYQFFWRVHGERPGGKSEF